MTQLGRGAMKLSRLIGTAQLNRRAPCASFMSPKLFSTEAAADDQFLQTPVSGPIYGRFVNITKFTGKSDIMNLLEGIELKPENLKVEYNRSYIPMSVMVEFPSLTAYNTALKTINRKGRFYSLQKADKSMWDMVAPFDGKAILMVGIPRTAQPDDIERFLSGCQYHSSSLSMFFKPTNNGLVRMGTVLFRSQAFAMHAYITKNRGFILNNQITVQVLY